LGFGGETKPPLEVTRFSSICMEKLDNIFNIFVFVDTFPTGSLPLEDNEF